MRTSCSCPVVSSSFFLFSSPNLSGRRGDVYHTSTHGLSANLECRSEMCYTLLAGKTGRKNHAKKSPSGHHRTTLPGCIFASKACIDNRNNLLNSNISSTCPHNMANVGPLTAEIGLPVWGTRAHFNGFRVLAALLHGTLASAKLCGVEQRAPSIFGKVAITLGIGPHSSCFS